jgi:hypothetical protein
MHLLYLVVVLAKGTIEFGLEQLCVFLRLVQLLLQSLISDDYVTIPLQKVGLLAGSLHQALRKTQSSISNQHSLMQDNSGCSQRTLIQFFIRRQDQMLRDMKAETISSSSSNSRPPWLEVPVSGIGVERSGTASSIIASRTTTSVPASGCGSTRASVLGLGAVKVMDLRAVEVVGSTTCSVGVASPVAVSITTASGIPAPSACAPVKIGLAVSGSYHYSPQ